jgi:hypothetical protein
MSYTTRNPPSAQNKNMFSQLRQQKVIIFSAVRQTEEKGTIGFDQTRTINIKNDFFGIFFRINCIKAQS